MNNKFSLDFGAKPLLFIDRKQESDRIINTFNSENPSSHIFILLGARGVGKTVLMTDVSKNLASDRDWIHIDIPGFESTMETLRSSLYKHTESFISKLSIEISGPVVNVSRKTDNDHSNYQVDLDSMLGVLKKRKKKLLITIDEACNTKELRIFTTYFQHCIREEYPIFVIMTGLYKNIRALQNNKSLTFLKRAPRIILGMLSISRIAWIYKDTFHISEENALALARHTNGYPYAFQILGYLLCDSSITELNEKIFYDYRTMLEEHSYDKIWEELSFREREVAAACARYHDMDIKSIREVLDMDSNNFSTYKDIIEKSGILSTSVPYGRVEFALPYIREFILKCSM